MTKKMTKAEIQLVTWLVIIGLPIYGVYKLGDTMGWLWFTLAVAMIVAGYIWYRMETKKKRRLELLSKYKDEQVVERILNHCFWQGQTAEQLRDSLGSPVEYDRKVLKAGKREIWKYFRTGKNRFDLRVTLENDFVIEWDDKHNR